MDPNINNDRAATSPQRQRYLDDLIKQIDNPTHRRIVGAYAKTGTVDGAEVELAKILEEVLHEN
jgi:hypothetical protein